MNASREKLPFAVDAATGSRVLATAVEREPALAAGGDRICHAKSTLDEGGMHVETAIYSFRDGYRLKSGRF